MLARVLFVADNFADDLVEVSLRVACHSFVELCAAECGKLEALELYAFCTGQLTAAVHTVD